MGKGNPRSALPAAGEAAPWHSLSGHNCGDNSIRAGELNSGKFQLLFPVLPRLDPAWNSPAGVQGAPRSSEPAPRPGCTSGPGAHRRSQPVYEQQPPAASRAPGALPDPGGKSRSSWGTLCHPFPAGQGHQLSPEPPQGMGTLPSTGGVTPCSALTPPASSKGPLEEQICLWRGWIEWDEAASGGDFLPRVTPRDFGPWGQHPPCPGHGNRRSAARARPGSTQNHLPATRKSLRMEQRTSSTFWGSCQHRERFGGNRGETGSPSWGVLNPQSPSWPKNDFVFFSSFCLKRRRDGAKPSKPQFLPHPRKGAASPRPGAALCPQPHTELLGGPLAPKGGVQPPQHLPAALPRPRRGTRSIPPASPATRA